MLGKLFTRAVVPPWGYTSPSNPVGYWPGDPEYGRTTQPLQLLTVSSCVRFISTQIAALPIDVYRESGDEKVPVTAPDWLEEPVPGLSFREWCGQVLSSLLLDGNAYILIGRNDRGGILSLRPLDVGSVRVENGRYFVKDKTGAELLHLRGLMLAGTEVGINPVAYARQSIELGMNALNYGADSFLAGFGNMPGVIQTPNALLPETKRELALQWQRKRRTGGRGLPGVLDAGATWNPVGISNEDAQFLQTRNYTAAEIAGQLFFVDPSELGIPVEGTGLTYKNLVELKTRRVEVTFLPWITPVEDAISKLLSRPRYMKFNVDALKRADQKTRYEGYQIGIRAKFLTPNEVRALEDLPPLPGGDVVVDIPDSAPVGGAPDA